MYGAAVLSAVFFDETEMKLSMMKEGIDFFNLLQDELLSRGIRFLHCFCKTQKEIRFAKFFGFEDFTIATDLGNYLGIKDLHV